MLIGRNGAGKTQLLEALEGGAAAIPGISVDEIERYDMGTFRSPNTGGANRSANHFARLTADAYLLPQPSGQSRIEAARGIFDACISLVEHESGALASDAFEDNLRDRIQQVPDFGVYTGLERESLYENTLHDEVLSPLIPDATGRRSRGSPNQPNNSFNGNQAALLSAAMKLSQKLPHELTQDDIMRAAHYEGNTLSNSVSAVFVAYKVDQFIWAHKRIETERVHYPELMAEYRSKYPPPWETLRDLLSDMRDAAGEDGLFNFDFSDPDGYELHMGNYEQFSFKAEMINRTTGAQYELDSLSSGEKVLMALCLASFNQHLGRRLPKLLLLDELDAVLHPSMVEALVRTLKTLFLPKGTKILTTSHSPMTVAVLDDADIFRVVRNGSHVQICSTTKTEAVGELSEGLATVDVGLRIAAYDEAKVSILSEGHNAKHLKRWVNLNFPADVHVIEGIEQHTNDNQLLSYGRLLARMNTQTHFVVVWDCDASSKAEDLSNELSRESNVTAYAFPKRLDNTIAQRGIENNYDEEILEPYSTTTVSSDGAVLSRGFQSNRKIEFANHVLSHGTLHYFSNFTGLHQIVSEILTGGTSNPSGDSG